MRTRGKLVSFTGAFYLNKGEDWLLKILVRRTSYLTGGRNDLADQHAVSL